MGNSSGTSAHRVFAALASAARRKILAYLSATSMTAGEISDRFKMSKSAVSQHLAVLEGAGLVTREKRGQFVHYTLAPNSLINTLNGYVQEVCPIGRPIRHESRERAKND